MSNRVVVQEGYKLPFSDFEGYRRRRRKSSKKRKAKGGARGRRSKFAAAARACKGRTAREFRMCMRRKLKG